MVEACRVNDQRLLPLLEVEVNHYYASSVGGDGLYPAAVMEGHQAVLRVFQLAAVAAVPLRHSFPRVPPCPLAVPSGGHRPAGSQPKKPFPPAGSLHGTPYLGELGRQGSCGAPSPPADKYSYG